MTITIITTTIIIRWSFDIDECSKKPIWKILLKHFVPQHFVQEKHANTFLQNQKTIITIIRKNGIVGKDEWKEEENNEDYLIQDGLLAMSLQAVQEQGKWMKE
jgi:hypothetical protein